MIKINKILLTQILSLISLFFCFSYTTYLPLSIPFYIVTLGSLFIFILYFHYKDLKNSFLLLLNKPNFKLFIILFIWILISILVSIFYQKFSIGEITRSVIGGFIFSIFLPYFLTFSVLSNFFDLKKISKIIFFILLIIYSFGLFDFIASHFNISLFGAIIHFIKNKPSATHGLDLSLFPRISSFFQEPSHYAFFLIVTFPIIFKLSFSKIKLFNSSLIDILAKRTTFLLMLFNLIAIQSPIFTIFFAIILIIMGIKKIIQLKPIKLLFISNMFATVILFFIIAGLLNFIVFDFSSTFISRAINVLSLVKDHPLLAMYADESFATRMVVYINYFIIFLKHPLFGIGFGNLAGQITGQLSISPIPLTPELMRVISNDYSGLASSMLFRFLAETGLVGTSILYSFFIFTLLMLNKKIKFVQNSVKDLLIGFKYFIILIIFTSWYDSHINLPFIWVFIGFMQAIIANKTTFEDKMG